MKPTSLVLLCAIFLLILAVQESEGYGASLPMGKREKLFKKVTIAELYIYNDIIHVAVALEIVLRNITHRVSNVERRSSLVCCGTTKNGTQFIARNFALYVPAWLVFSKKTQLQAVCR